METITAKTPWAGSMGSTPMHLDYFEGSMFEAVEAIAEKYPNYVAFDFMGKPTTYKKLVQEVETCAKALKTIGVREGDKVTIAMPNCPQAIYLFYAINLVGGIANMVHPLSAEKEIEFYLNESESVTAITLDQFYNKFESVRKNTKVVNIIIASINNDTKEVKLVSVYRDSYLDVGSGSFQKCNAAYALGGPEQAISMLNVNLDLDIQNYVTVDFNAIVECVDLLGGVEIEITDDEAVLMTGYIKEINKLTKNKAEYLTKGGTYNLNGVQACAYARIRYGGGDDYRRTERQRTVLTAMVKKAQKSDLVTVNKLINQVCGDIQTSFSNTELIALASQVFSYSIGESTGFPFTKATKVMSKKIGDVVVPCDLCTNVVQLHEFMFDDTDYQVSETVSKNSAKIISDTGYREGDGF